MNAVLQDVRYGWRMLRKNPAFALIAVAALALGIGGNTAVFSAVNAVLLHRLPIRDADRVVLVRQATARDYGWAMSVPDFDDYVATQKTFSALSQWQSQSVNYTGGDHPDRVIGSFVSANFFSMLGVGTQLGRTFTPGEDRPGARNVAVLSYNAWQSRFGSDPQIVGRKLVLNGEPYEVVGVLPRSFQMPWFDSDVWMTIQHYPNYRLDRDQAVSMVFGRVRGGVTTAAATADLQPVAERLAHDFPATHAGVHIVLTPMWEMVTTNYTPMLMLLWSGIGAVLLIACANVANLLLARGSARQQEIAVRLAIGGSRARILRQLLTESMLLATIAGVAALLVGSWLNHILVDLVPGGLPFYTGELEPRAIGFTLGLALLTGLLFGIAPGWQLSGLPLARTLGSGTRTSGDGRRWSARSIFVVTQIALSVALLVASVLLVRSLRAMLHESLGFNPQQLLTGEYRLPRTKYTTLASRWQFHQALLEKLRAIPGVQAASIAQAGPFSGNGGNTAVVPPGGDPNQKGNLPRAAVNIVTGDYFSTMAIPLLRGRTFNDGDTGASTPVIVITRALADRFWPHGDALGQQLMFPNASFSAEGSAATIAATVVGVVDDSKQRTLTDARAMPRAYFAYPQLGGIFGTLVVRTAVEPMSLADAVRRAVWSVDADQPVWKVRTVELLIEQDSGPQRYVSSLMGGFGGLALFLTLIGTYGVVSYSVAQRTREFGIRMALGAVPRDLLRLVLGQGAALAAAGIVAGLLLGAAAVSLLRSMLYGVSAFDPASFVAASALIAVAALGATLIPALRATKVDPMVALRYE
jgi:putative ABC transport system permease protein